MNKTKRKQQAHRRKETVERTLVGAINDNLNKLEQAIDGHGLPRETSDTTPQGRARREVWKAIRAWKEDK